MTHRLFRCKLLYNLIITALITAIYSRIALFVIYSISDPAKN
ncbi:MAG: hypothetical protein [Olavius algarvensis spirochete endosymbiont]|nr:MAG: hypothetical protein [Olavius algarvensis spirochete endosymbiont]